MTFNCDFVTLAASDVCLHAFDFIGGHPGRLVVVKAHSRPCSMAL
jgi:hypothetical protein